jgi:hypothetical protein
LTLASTILFIDCAFRQSCIFRLRFSSCRLHRKPKQINETFLPETILFDAALLFLPDGRESSRPLAIGPFESLIFSVTTDDDLLDQRHIERFCPSIFHVPELSNTAALPEFARTNFTCKIRDRQFNLFHEPDKPIDAAVAIALPAETTVTFELHDHEYTFPDIRTFRGSGVSRPFELLAVPVEQEPTQRPAGTEELPRAVSEAPRV